MDQNIHPSKNSPREKAQQPHSYVRPLVVGMTLAPNSFSSPSYRFRERLSKSIEWSHKSLMADLLRASRQLRFASFETKQYQGTNDQMSTWGNKESA